MTDTHDAKPRVAVIGTGGTISSLGAHSLEISSYIDRGDRLEVEDLLARVPEIHRVAEIVPVPFAALPSTAIGPPDWLNLARTVTDTVKADPTLSGVAITHGTASLEETAYFLNLTLPVDVPVVLVGAQRPASALSGDGPMNLVNAIRVAGAPQSRGMGVLTLLNDEIHAARDVSKTSTLRLQTFRTPDFGALGHVDEDAVSFYRRPIRRHVPDTAFELAALPETLPRVDIAMTYAGADGAAIEAFVNAGASGIVAAGFAPGLSTPLQLEALRAARARGLVIVQSSRVGSGRIIGLRTQHVPGNVTADNLTPQKARILLMLALTQTNDPVKVQALFNTH